MGLVPDWRHAERCVPVNRARMGAAGPPASRLSSGRQRGSRLRIERVPGIAGGPVAGARFRGWPALSGREPPWRRAAPPLYPAITVRRAVK